MLFFSFEEHSVFPSPAHTVSVIQGPAEMPLHYNVFLEGQLSICVTELKMKCVLFRVVPSPLVPPFNIF